MYGIHMNSITMGWMSIFGGKGCKYVGNFTRTPFCKFGSGKVERI
jgi:hypothetical protein